MQIIRLIIAKLGGFLLSKKNFENIIAQRDSAVKKLAAMESSNLKTGLVGVVFSKDLSLIHISEPTRPY